MMAVIGGSGLARLGQPFVFSHEHPADTPWGKASAPVRAGVCAGKPMLFLPRHGDPHTLAPHLVNYRANLSALHAQGATGVIAINAVGGIRADLRTSRIVIPNQIIDYTHGRPHSFHSSEDTVRHVDFTHPYTQRLRAALLEAAAEHDPVDGAVHGVTQGPRLETAAEIQRMEQDGCDIVGMTGMPEAALARELGLEYACCALVVNPAAGKSSAPLDMREIERNMRDGLKKIEHTLRGFFMGAAA